ncbi:MAG: hypothetical protein ABIO02_03865, partial [Patescibacteria group bacterium]
MTDGSTPENGQEIKSPVEMAEDAIREVVMKAPVNSPEAHAFFDLKGILQAEHEHDLLLTRLENESRTLTVGEESYLRRAEIRLESARALIDERHIS